ncbi:ATP12 family chaperone protein [Phenylobacterium sp.]|uniref:ATP12 family chaperone protein n=1 Tax=Phenylobacterium sp. TaxID=1871053 RepID=UPI002736E60D|nr:ATP12 family protein [Phenylobacterium sp.]MDP3659028.1 ATP12 family protein [Phenylobacterium sp.]
MSEGPGIKRGFREPGDKPKRFYKQVDVAAGDAGFQVKLDNRSVRTPGGVVLSLPTRALAEQIAEEWSGQGEILDLVSMHATRLANTAIDAVPQARDVTAASVAHFAASDLVCYFAEAPAGLVRRQVETWEPILARAERELGLTFVRAGGIVHQAQPQATLDAVKALALALDDFHLAALAFSTALYGSAVLGLAALNGWLGAEAAFDASRLDEAWQEDQWGVDAEAAERTARLRTEARMLERWLAALA